MKTIFGFVFLVAGCLAAKLPSSYVPPAAQPVASAPVRVQQSYVPPAAQPVASAPVRVQQSYVPPAAQPVASAPVRVQQSYVPPAAQPVATSPVKQLKETYVPPKKASPVIVFPKNGEPAPWHPNPQRQPEQPLIVSGGASQPGSGYVPPAREAPSAPRQTYVPPAKSAPSPQRTYVPPTY